MSKKLKQNCKLCKKMRGNEILKNNPLHLEIMVGGGGGGSRVGVSSTSKNRPSHKSPNTLSRNRAERL